MKSKILFYTSGVGLGGVERVILEVLKLIDKDKFDIKLALQYENENLFENEIPKEIDYKYMLPLKIINKSLYYRERKKNLFFKILYSLNLIYEKYIIKKNYLEFSKDRDIVIDFKSGDFLKLITLNKNSKKICWLHSEITKLNRYSQRKEKLRKYLKDMDKIVCICNEMKDNFIIEMPEYKDKVEVIYNPFDIEKIIKKADEIEKLSLDDKKRLNDTYMIMVSRLELKMKDFFTLFEAFKIVKKKNKQIKLYLLGDGPDKKIIQEKIEEMALKEDIVLLGQRKNPYPWIKNSKLLIHSSLSEGFGLVLVEGLILNKNIISTNCKVGPKEILDYGNYGVLVDIKDYQSMALEIEKILIKSKDINYKEAIERFEGKKIIKKLEKLLKEIEVKN